LSWAHYLRGRAFTGQGRFDEAIAEFDKTLQLDSGSVWAWYYRAQNHAYRQEYSLALRQLREAVERFPKAEAPHLGLAWFLATCPHDAYRDGKEAVAEATKGCEIAHWAAWYAADVLGAAYAELGDFEQAIKYANLALSLQGASPGERAVVEQRLSRYQHRIANRDAGGADKTPSFFEEAINAYARHDYDRAISCLNAVLPPNPGTSTAAVFHIFDGRHDRRSRVPWSPGESAAMTNGFYYRGLSYQAKREWDKAIADFTTAIWREPGSMLALAERGISYRQKGQMDWAFRDFDEMIRRKPNDALGHALRADTLHWTKEWDAALEAADTATRLDPKLALSYEVRGRAYASKKEYEKADREFNEAERVEPERVEKILTRAFTFKRKGNYTLAETEYRETAERFPRSAYAHNALAWFLATCPDAASRNGADAIAYAKSACELTKWQDADYLDTLAAAYAEKGDFDKAVKYVREAIAKMEAKSDSRNEIEGHLVLFQRKEACRDTR
ncbi:MAG TPA: tetratricopeptide repeat protein, partial [Chthoniobacterales bacterium]